MARSTTPVRGILPRLPPRIPHQAPIPGPATRRTGPRDHTADAPRRRGQPDPPPRPPPPRPQRPARARPGPSGDPRARVRAPPPARNPSRPAAPRPPAPRRSAVSSGPPSGRVPPAAGLPARYGRSDRRRARSSRPSRTAGGRATGAGLHDEPPVAGQQRARRGRRTPASTASCSAVMPGSGRSKMTTSYARPLGSCRAQPAERVRGHDLDPRVVEAMPPLSAVSVGRARQPDHVRVQFDDVSAHSGVAQHLARRQAVPAAEDEHPAPAAAAIAGWTSASW